MSDLDLDAIRTRLERFECASEAYEAHRKRYPGFGSTARKLEQQMISAYDLAIIRHAPADLRALLDAHDADQARSLELALELEGAYQNQGDMQDRVTALEAALQEIAAWEEPDYVMDDRYRDGYSAMMENAQDIARAALKGGDDETLA